MFQISHTLPWSNSVKSLHALTHSDANKEDGWNLQVHFCDANCLSDLISYNVFYFDYEYKMTNWILNLNAKRFNSCIATSIFGRYDGFPCLLSTIFS